MQSKVKKKKKKLSSDVLLSGYISSCRLLFFLDSLVWFHLSKLKNNKVAVSGSPSVHSAYCCVFCFDMLKTRTKQALFIMWCFSKHLPLVLLADSGKAEPHCLFNKEATLQQEPALLHQGHMLQTMKRKCIVCY